MRISTVQRLVSLWLNLVVHRGEFPQNFELLNLQRLTQQVTSQVTRKDCSCGYSVNSTSSSSHAVFTEILETDFLHIYNLSSNPCWAVQEYNVTAEAGRGEYGKMCTPQNAIPNPYGTLNQWTGQGIHGGDPGLQLWVGNELVDGLVPMAEIAVREENMLYGSFRIGMKITAVPGTCSAFFWFRNNSQEIDMEFLSSSFNATSQPVHLVMQTPQSALQGYNANGTSTYDVAELPFYPSLGFHEYRFDWTPNGVTFYADGTWLTYLDWDYPDSPGHLTINHWSNGNPLWSQGPPSVTASTTISYVKAYYNSTSPHKQAGHGGRCPKYDSTMICQIPDQTFAPDPDDEDAEFFLSGGSMCGEKSTSYVMTATEVSSRSTAVHTNTGSSTRSVISSSTGHAGLNATATNGAITDYLSSKRPPEAEASILGNWDAILLLAVSWLGIVALLV